MSVLDLDGKVIPFAGAPARPHHGPQEADERALIRAAIAGDEAARMLLGKRIRPVLRARVRQFLKGRRPPRLGPDDCEDLMQLIWLRLTENRGRLLRQFDPERGMGLEGFVGLIARRELYRRQRELQAQRRGGGDTPVELAQAGSEPAADAACPERRVAEREQVDLLVRHLGQQLPARGKLIFSALYVDELSVAETARMLNVQTQVVYNWQHRIRVLARAYLTGETR